MFTYMDANEKRPSLETLMEDYWKLLPEYQPSIKDPETDLDIKRVLFARSPFGHLVVSRRGFPLIKEKVKWLPAPQEGPV